MGCRCGLAGFPTQQNRFFSVTEHIRAIYMDGEREQAATCNDHLQVRIEGRREVSRRIAYYNLSMIMAVGFRVRSPEEVSSGAGRSPL